MTMFWYMYLVYSIAGTLAALTIFLLGLIIYIKLSMGKCKSNANLRGKTTIVTGANTGIGYETALDFARRDAKVILACRTKSKGIEAVEKIIKLTNNNAVFFKELDLSSLKSVREFAEHINQSEPRLDILVNNAGAVALPDQITEDGLMLLMQTNYFGPFLLTILLLELMKRTLNSRIINVSSLLAKYARNLENAREGAETTIYCSVAEGIESLSGQHFHDCHVVRRYQTARDRDLPEKLWKISARMVNLN